MGEIGIPHDTFMHVLTWWQVHCIIEGYNRRRRDLWSATRWQTYYLMLAQVGSKGMREAGIHRPSSLMTFPWEKEEQSPLSDDDVKELQDLMQNYTW